MLADIQNSIVSGYNVLLLGPGGTGKTHALRQLAEFCKQLYKSSDNEKKNSYYAFEKAAFSNITESVCCVATTGIAAVNLNVPGVRCSTLHSWAGIGLGDGTVKQLITRVKKSSGARSRWRKTKVLILDEISMLGKELFEKLDDIAREVRKSQLPFGGLQIVAAGDFLQLPPVKDAFVFTSAKWDGMNWDRFNFEEMRRFDDPRWFDILSRLRIGEPNENDVQMLREQVTAYKNWRKEDRLKRERGELCVIRPTLMFSRRADVSSYNEKKLRQLPGKDHEFLAMSDVAQPGSHAPFVTKSLRKKMLKIYASKLNCMSPDKISLRVGAQVMLTRNLSVPLGLINGSRGVVTDILPGAAKVKFINGEEIWVKLVKSTYEDDEIYLERQQIPLILAWALTIHKVQGCTLDYAICNIGRAIFCPGQAYVALSRVRSLKGLFLSRLDPKKIYADENALEYCEHQ